MSKVKYINLLLYFNGDRQDSLCFAQGTKLSSLVKGYNVNISIKYVIETMSQCRKDNIVHSLKCLYCLQNMPLT